MTKSNRITPGTTIASPANHGQSMRATASPRAKQHVTPLSASGGNPRKKAASQPAQALPCAPDATKHQRILALLQRDTGASIAELQSVTGWQAHSVRGFLSATVRKKLQLALVAEMRATGERVYHITGGEHA